MKSFMASPSTIERKWYVVDATDILRSSCIRDRKHFKRKEQANIYTTH